jgi:hypothetical protein
MFNPYIIFQNAKSLYFSAFGVPMDEFQVRYNIKVPLSGDNMMNRSNNSHKQQHQQLRSSSTSIQTNYNFNNFIENIINFFVPRWNKSNQNNNNNNNNDNTKKFRLMNKDKIIKSIDQSQWVSIPSVYIQNKNMINSLIPLILIAIGTSVFTYSSSIVIDDYQNNNDNYNNIVVGGGDGDDLMSRMNNYNNPGKINNLNINNNNNNNNNNYNNKNDNINMNIIDSTILPSTILSTSITTTTLSSSSLSSSTIIPTPTSSFLSNTIFSTEISPEIEQVTSTIIDAFSLVLLVQLAKIIGKDRDAVIASKIQSIAKEFPVSRIYCTYCSVMIQDV